MSALGSRFAQIFLHELADGGTVRSLGVIYALMIASGELGGDGSNIQRCNRAVIDTHGMPRLEAIKKVAWKVVERETPAQEAA